MHSGLLVRIRSFRQAIDDIACRPNTSEVAEHDRCARTRLLQPGRNWQCAREVAARSRRVDDESRLQTERRSLSQSCQVNRVVGKRGTRELNVIAVINAPRLRLAHEVLI